MDNIEQNLHELIAKIHSDMRRLASAKVEELHSDKEASPEMDELFRGGRKEAFYEEARRGLYVSISSPYFCLVQSECVYRWTFWFFEWEPWVGLERSAGTSWGDARWCAPYFRAHITGDNLALAAAELQKHYPDVLTRMAVLIEEQLQARYSELLEEADQLKLKKE